jgi:hypothetical protein
MNPNLPAAQQLPWYMQGIAPTPVPTQLIQGSPQMGMPRLPFMQFAPPQGQPQMHPMPQQNIQPVPRPMPQPGGMFAPPPAAAAAQPARGLFGGRFDSFGQRIGDVMRENPMAWSAVASGLMDKRQNNNVTFSDITGNAMRGGAYDTAQKDKKEEKDKEAKRESVTRKWVMGMGFSEDDADAAMAEPEILNYLIQQRQGRDPTALMDEYDWAKQSGYEGSPIDFIRLKQGAGEDATSDMKEWKQENADRAARGEPPLGLMEYQIKMREAGRSQVNIDTGVKLPAGYRWKDPNNQEAGVEPIPGGPGEQLSPEVSGRLGMADNFLRQAPALREEISKGGVTGPSDLTEARVNDQSKQASVLRKIKSGTDALRRMLTGAGMPASEAADYVKRYEPTYTDNAASMTDKLDQLVNELEAIRESSTRGRGGAQETAPENDPLGSLD